MPSPFPGMDPNMEAPGIWPGFHHTLATEIRGELNRILPQPYYADVESRAELGIIEEGGELRQLVPDVALLRHPAPTPGVEEWGVAVAVRPRRKVTPQVELEVLVEPIRHLYVEIRDAKQGHRYTGPVPAPALVEEDAAWAAERTRPWREARAQP